MAKAKVPVVPGKRIGTKRSDRRWQDEQGRIWDSMFEYGVYRAIKGSGYNTRRCDESDTIVYGSGVQGGHCLACGSSEVIQGRRYTADLFVMGTGSERGGGGYLLELKGYWRQSARGLFREVAKQLRKEDISLRIVFESNSSRSLGGATTMTPVEYIHRYCKNVMPGVFNKVTQEIEWYELTKG